MVGWRCNKQGLSRGIPKSHIPVTPLMLGESADYPSQELHKPSFDRKRGLD